jgi:hypothetical protein
MIMSFEQKSGKMNFFFKNFDKFVEALRVSFQMFFPALLKASVWLVVLVFVCEGLNEAGLYYGSIVFPEGSDEILRTLYHVLVQILVSVTEGFFALFFSAIACDLAQNKSNESFTNALKRYWNSSVKDLSVEYIRAIAYILLWTLALILPGMWKQIRYSFMAYIVMFDPEYKKGNIDPLAESESLMRGITRWMILMFILVNVADFYVVKLKAKETLTSAPLMVSFVLVISVLLNFYFYCFNYAFYKLRLASGTRGEL